jgi:hypothetical protein
VLTYAQALPYVAHVIDTAGSADRKLSDIQGRAVLVGWQCGFEPLFVAVIDCYSDADGRPRDLPGEQEAMELAEEWLRELKWFARDNDVPDANPPDHVVFPNDGAKVNA